MESRGPFLKTGSSEKMVAHYVALNPIVCLLVASINRPLSGCLNQNDSNTGSVMMPSQHSIQNRETGWRRGREEEKQEERGEEKRGKKSGENKRKEANHESCNKGKIITRRLGKGPIVRYPDGSLENQEEMTGSVRIPLMNCCCTVVFHLVLLDHIKQFQTQSK